MLTGQTFYPRNQELWVTIARTDTASGAARFQRSNLLHKPVECLALSLFSNFDCARIKISSLDALVEFHPGLRLSSGFALSVALAFPAD